MSLRSDLARAQQQHTIQNQTSTMLALGANLMNQTMAQTHKLTAVEAQVTGAPSESQADPPGFLSFPVSVLGRSGPEVPWPPLSLMIHTHNQASPSTPLCELNAKTAGHQVKAILTKPLAPGIRVHWENWVIESL